MELRSATNFAVPSAFWTNFIPFPLLIDKVMLPSNALKSLTVVPFWSYASNGISNFSPTTAYSAGVLNANFTTAPAASATTSYVLFVPVFVEMICTVAVPPFSAISPAFKVTATYVFPSTSVVVIVLISGLMKIGFVDRMVKSGVAAASLSASMTFPYWSYAVNSNWYT